MRIPASLTTNVLRQLLREGVPNDTPLDPQVVDNAMSVVTAVQANHDQLTSRILQETRRDADLEAGTLRLIAILLGCAGIALGFVLGMVTAGMVAA